MRAPRTKLFILLSTQGAIYFAIALFAPLYAIYVEHIGGEILTAGSAIAVFAGVTGLMTLVIGRFASRYATARTVAVSGWVILGFGFLGYLFVKTPAHLFIIQAVLGLATAAYFPPVEALYSRFVTHRSERDIVQWSWWDTMEYWAQAGGAFVGALIVTAWGFPALFIIMSLLAFLAAISLLVLLPPNT